MTYTVWESGYKKRRHWRLLISDDWFSFTPWTENKKPVNYFAKRVCYSETKQTRLDLFYIGPFAIIFGKYTP